MKSLSCRRQSRCGHTLLEMTLVVTLMSVLISLVVRAQRPFSEMVLQLQDRAVSVSELRLATDYLARDLGGAASVQRKSETSLLIRREAAVLRKHETLEGQKDQGILYSFQDGKLVRQDLQVGGAFVVATGLTGFDVGRMRKHELRIQVADGLDPDRHKITLVWRER